MAQEKTHASAGTALPCPGDGTVAGLYRRFDTPLPVRAHCCAVAWEADRLARTSGTPVDAPLLRAACLLHDLCRAAGRDHPALAARTLAGAGWPTVGELVRQHHDLGADPSPEAELLFLADKHIQGTRRCSLDRRFAAARERCGSPEALRLWQRRREEALALEQKYAGDGDGGAESCAGLILAAGRSSRMGEFKPLLELDGISMVRRVAGMMIRAGCGPVLVVTGRQAPRLEAHLAGWPVSFVHNPDYARTQQLDSLRLGLAALEGRGRRVLICPADVPLAADRTARQILGTEALFARPVFGERAGHPAAMALALTPYLLSYDGPQGLRGAMEKGGVTPVDVPVEDAAVVMDNDTPEDLRRSAAWWQQNRKETEQDETAF